MRYRRYIDMNPRQITAKFDCICAETGQKIAKGEKCVYYPLGKKVFHVDSKQAQEFREMKADEAQGYVY